jgi:predicted DNA-binding transcriptional regulator YafY
MDAISEAEITDVYFERPADFDLQAFANRGFALYQNEAEYGEVAWRFAPQAAAYVRGTLFHPEQEEEELSDGSIVIRFKAAGHLEMAWYLYQWGDKVEVLKPAVLRDMVKNHRRSDFAALP